ncbi:MAG TPA: hypothetical protein VGA70_06805 [Longimicrobiales bacterium]
MVSVLVLAVVTGASFLVSLLATPLVRSATIRLGLVRGVQADRWHTRPTPATGGVAIFGAFILVIGGWLAMGPDALQALGEPVPRALLPLSPLLGLLLASTVAFFVGLVDDVADLSPAAKLAGQILAASILLLSGTGVWLTGSQVVDTAISIVWFVGITNALNLLDNMDGLAAGVAVVAALYLSLIFALDAQVTLMVPTLAFAGAVIGFLLHNYPPARVFMGDAGSHFLGLFLAGLALSPGSGLSRSLLAVVAVPAFVLAIPILDTTLVTVGRVLEGRPITQGGKDHTSHHLVAMGLPEERAVWILWGLAAVGGGAGVMVRTASRGTAALLGGLLVMALTLLGTFILSVRLRSVRSEERGGVAVQRLLLDLNERYPVLTVFLDAGLVALAYYAAYLIRWDPDQILAELPYFRRTLVIVVAAKLVALVASGVYGSRWLHFSLSDAIRLIQASLLGTLVVAAALLWLQRTGLSRGVLSVDFLITTGLLIVSRISFRAMEEAARRWSRRGSEVVILGHMEDVELARRALERMGPDGLRPVAVADPDFRGARGKVAGLWLFGGQDALTVALARTSAPAVLVVGDDLEGAVGRHLEREGAVDLYRLRVEVERLVP